MKVVAFAVTQVCTRLWLAFGATVMLRANTDPRGMLTALREFGDKLRGGAHSVSTP
jgi:hypothetical protein